MSRRPRRSRSTVSTRIGVARVVAVVVVGELEAVEIDDVEPAGRAPRTIRACSRASASSSARRLGALVERVGARYRALALELRGLSLVCARSATRQHRNQGADRRDGQQRRRGLRGDEHGEERRDDDRLRRIDDRAGERSRPARAGSCGRGRPGPARAARAGRRRPPRQPPSPRCRSRRPAGACRSDPPRSPRSTSATPPSASGARRRWSPSASLAAPVRAPATGRRSGLRGPSPGSSACTRSAARRACRSARTGGERDEACELERRKLDDEPMPGSPHEQQEDGDHRIAEDEPRAAPWIGDLRRRRWRSSRSVLVREGRDTEKRPTSLYVVDPAFGGIPLTGALIPRFSSGIPRSRHANPDGPTSNRAWNRESHGAGCSRPRDGTSRRRNEWSPTSQRAPRYRCFSHSVTCTRYSFHSRRLSST